MLNELEATVPQVFVHEYINGMPMYMKGYRELGNDVERVEEIKGVGGIHSLLATVFMHVLHENFQEKNTGCLVAGQAWK